VAARFLIDCGASALMAMKRYGVDVNGIHLMLLWHLDGDHVGGLPFLVVDGQFPIAHARSSSPAWT
jgi:ribonuclease BN (tRNA processing enzyme)